MTQFHSLESVRLSARELVTLLFATAAVLTVAYLISTAGGAVHLLQSAGLTAGSGAIAGVANFVDKIKGNIVWLAATAVGLMAAVVGFLFMSGHSRAQDYAIKGACGLLIIVAVPGIVS